MARAKSSPTGRKSAGTRRRRAGADATPVLRPEHQRELFALGLITIAAVTVVFYVTGTAGVIGASWVELTRRLLGWGALVVPLSLGLLGVAILLQEQYEDVRLTGATVLGTLLVLTALLVLLEFSIGTRDGFDARVGEGGGIVGFAILALLSQAIGRPATFVIACLTGLAGILLTFDITLHELSSSLRDGFARFWVTVWSPSTRRAPAAEAETPRLSQADVHSSPAHVPSPQTDDEIVPTPIAERPTRASLFQRPETRTRRSSESTSAPAVKPDTASPPASGAALSNTTLLTNLLTTPVGGAPAEVVQKSLEGFDVSPVHRAWPLPPLDLLDHYPEGTITDEEKRLRSRLIEETLASFKVEAQVVGVNTGPAVTQFELQPAVGVKVSKITTLEKDLALALAATSIRIEAPIPGKNVIGIEIPNSSISIVGMREVIESEEFERAKGRLKWPLGKDVSGTPIVAALDRMPHALMAGATGTGKSAGINALVCSLLLKHTPDELKFIMVDPKRVELIVYNQIPHMLSPVVTELERVVPTLKWATREMERRYKVFARYGVRNIEGYNAAARRRADLEPLPYIVIIIDELADLMMMAPDEVETLICRLAQMARATGIHLVIATQRPSVDVVTGLIKANFPTRIAFAVTSQTDSRVILDMNGAEQLLGRGDMLYMAADAARPIRLQGTWVSEAEVERIVQFWRNATPPKTDDEKGKPSETEKEKADDQSDMQPPAEFLSVAEQDELLPQAIKLVQQHNRASASLLQRRLRIGYSKAAQLIDLLEQQGIVGPAEEGRSREVLKRAED
ncbi:MAG: DNA translocase FtsK [Roseiflexus sp.]|nr:DNA translocase FtsK [Roseiflexus sp.]MCS7287503.1 DNA translocase FtsK [Roseiflexus sp.]MDW8231359.1 DNA translocase FtsK 4TM domain-containing protein [Roseiflexaceae bacterium]